MTAVYLETSALLRMLFNEDRGGEVQERLLAAEHVVASRLIQVETRRALIRLGLVRPGSETAIADLQRELRHLWPAIHFFEITREICDFAGRVASTSHLRILDAIHLATYLSARQLSPSLEMISFDERLLREVQ